MNQKGKILVVDDNVGIRQILKRRLGEIGYDVDTAEDGYIAFKKVHEDGADLVMTDIVMPRMDGIELIKQLKPVHPDVPVIALSGLHDVSTVKMAMKEGACDYLFKPFDFDEAEMTIERALEKRRLYLENMDYQKNLEKKVNEQAEKIRDLYLEAVESLAIALEEKDTYTHGHSSRVSKISVAVGREIGLGEEDLRMLRLGDFYMILGK